MGMPVFRRFAWRRMLEWVDVRGRELVRILMRCLL
jgi:hypothetical protein